MQNKDILLPVCAQALLTLAVWITLYWTRLGTMKRKRVNPQLLADEAKASVILKDVVNPSDNFENLFEMPVLFFAAVFAVIAAGRVDALYVQLAWAFVGFRALHSLIHCTYNRVVHRFTAYLFSSLALWAIWIRLTVQFTFGN